MKKVLSALFLLIVGFNVVSGGEVILHKSLPWHNPITLNYGDAEVHVLGFNEAYYPVSPFLPFFQETVFFNDPDQRFKAVEVSNPVYDSTDVSAFIRFDDQELIGSELIVSSGKAGARHQLGVQVSFAPFIVDASTGKVFRLLAFDLHIYTETITHKTMPLKQDFVNRSVLEAGNWYKFTVSEAGVYKITHSDLVQAGLNPGTINPRHLRIYGNGGGMLPELNSGFRHDDLVENAIIVFGEEDGVFNQQDYILFFGQSPHEWKYAINSTAFEYRHNIYDDFNYYYLTTDLGAGKRMVVQAGTSQEKTHVVNVFNDYKVHQLNERNLMSSGRQWFGEAFDAVLSRNYNFSFPNRITDSAFYVRSNVAAKSLIATSFVFNINGSTFQTNVSAIPTGTTYPAFARSASLSRSVTSNQENASISITYNKSPMPSTGWLNYIWVHAIRHLRMAGDQMAFRNLYTTGANRVSEFRIENTSSVHNVWDVTDPANVKIQETTLQANQLVYTLATSHLREFIVFDPAKALSSKFIEKVPNQNLHGVDVPHYLIVTPVEFLFEANRLADFHRTYSGLDVLVATTTEIYNEFSSGKQDVAAIRDFARMLYNRSGNGKDFQYLLLFGDASFDYKDRTSRNTNFVPVWASQESLDPLYSYVMDDFFGFLDPHEGGAGTNILDIGIGRLPVSSEAEAAAMVDKIIHYAGTTHATMADWRNYICFVADDEDANMHVNQAEILAADIDANFTAFNLYKIYLDAYQQVTVPGGQRYPDANADINRRVQQGALIVNYTGHGGVRGWAHERVLELADIRRWTNYDRMPVFITATCEFAYFDDPALTSAGELVILNPNGGGIALFTTSRPTFATQNFQLNRRIFEHALPRNNARLGDVIRLAKQFSGNDTNARRFLLLGDPALKLAIPEYNIITTHVNSFDINETTDTLRALSMVSMQGKVTDHAGEVMEDFNGILTPTIFDKTRKVNTRANDGGEPRSFSVQENIIYKGNVSIVSGEFSFSFIVPKDIAYAYGPGKISYYATDGYRDAHGSDNRIFIGGFDVAAIADNQGPEIELYINDEKFLDGGITNENPVLFAIVSDDSGINTSGIGIGHDITAVLNHQTNKAHILNDFYKADLDTYLSGTIRYPFFNLPDGRHHLRLKVWDIHNNPSEASIEFVVASSGVLALTEVLNYPNPFRDRTEFIVEHNQAATNLEFEIQIYSLDGRLRKILQAQIRPGGFRTEPIGWDGRGDDGQLLESGTYVYKVLLRHPDQGLKEKGNKLVIIR